MAAEQGRVTIKAVLDASGIERGAAKAKKAVAGVDGKPLEGVGEQADKAGGKLDTLADKASRVGDALTKYLSAPIAGAGAAVVKTAADWDSALGRVQAATGKGVDEAQELLEVGRDLWRDGWSDSVEGMTSGLVEAYEVLGDISGEDMSTVLRAAQTLSTTFGSDLGYNLRGIDALMTNFGLSAQEASDLMVAGAQRGLDYTDELGDNLAEYSGRWADAGLSASEYFSLLEAGTENGAYNLDKVADFLNEFLTSLSDGRMEDGIQGFSEGTQAIWESYKQGGATAQDVLQAVVGELRDGKTETEAMTTASEIWSSLGEDNCLSMITSLAGVSDSFADVSGSTDQAAGAIEDSLGNRARSAVRNLQDALSPFAEEAVELLERVADAVSDVAEWFSGLDEGTQDAIVNMALALAAVGPLVKALGGVVSTLGKVGDKLGGIGKKSGGVKESSDWLGKLGDNAGKAAGKAEGLLGKLGKFAGKAAGVGIVAEVANAVATALQGSSEEFQQTETAFDESVQACIDSAGNFTEAAGQFTADNMAMWEQFNADTEASQKSNQGLWGNFQMWVADNWSYFGDRTASALAEMVNEVDLQTTSAWLAAQASAVAGGQALDETTRANVETIISSFDDMPDSMAGVCDQSMQALAAGMAAYIPELSGYADMTAEEIIQTIRDTVLNPEYGTGATGSQASAELAAGLQSGEPATQAAAQGLADAASEGVSPTPGELGATGDEAGASYSSSIASHEGDAYSAGSALQGAAESGASPSADAMYGQGDAGGAAYADAVASNEGDAYAAGSGLLDSSLEELQQGHQMYASYGQSSGQRYAFEISQASGEAGRRAGLLVSAAVGALSNTGQFWTWGYDSGDTYADGIYAAASRVRSASSYLASVQAAYLHHTTPDVGPLKGDDEWGFEMGEQIAEGIDAAAPLVSAASLGMARDAAAPLAGSYDRASALGLSGGAPPSWGQAATAAAQRSATAQAAPASVVINVAATVREEADVDRLSRAMARRVASALRGRGAV